MGQEEIIRKLSIELKKDIRNECQVVYILSRIRKILEMKNQRDKYKLLNFYCNWSLHVNLKYKNTTQSVSQMFDKYIDPSKSVRDIAREIKSNHADFFKLNDFKNETMNFLKDNDLPICLVNKNEYWINFIKLLLEIIKECPVICIESSKKIDRLTLIKDNNNYCYKFDLANNRHKPIIKLKFG